METKPLADQAGTPYTIGATKKAKPVRITSEHTVPGHLSIVHGSVASRTAKGDLVPFVHGPGQAPVCPIAAGLATFSPYDEAEDKEPAEEERAAQTDALALEPTAAEPAAPRDAPEAA